MSKKGIIYTFVSFKKYLIIILIVALLVFFYYYFTILRPLGIVPSPTSCPSGVIPDRLNLILGGGGMSSSPYYLQETQPIYNTTWLDGTRIDFFSCNPGQNENENINYIYCKNIFYSGKQINSNGVIEKNYNIYINLILDSKDKTDQGFKILKETCNNAV